MAIQSLNTIKNWFKTALKPTQLQFSDTWDSFWHKNDTIPTSSIENLDSRFDDKADNDSLQSHISDDDAHNITDRLAGKVDAQELQDESAARTNSDNGLQDQIDELKINEDTPVADSEAEAIILGLSSYRIYITTTGEVRYKLPTVEPETPSPPTIGVVDDENNEFTFTGGEE